MLTVFANIRINSEERLEHMKDSFETFKSASDNWLINVRGAYRDQAIVFLRSHLGVRGVFFELLDDSRGWIENALDMLPHARNPYVLVWNEDHLNITSPELLVRISGEMQTCNADYLLYSWWQKGKAREALEKLPLRHGSDIDYIYLTAEHWKYALDAGFSYYLLSLCGIFRKDFFKKLLLSDRRKLPFSFTKNLYRGMTLLQRSGLRFDQKEWFHRINRIAGFKLRRFPKETPFDLEKAPDRFDMLPFTLALSKRELFACIDDDNNARDRGSSLVARGLYPRRNIIRSEAAVPAEMLPPERIKLSPGEIWRGQYYQDTNRQQMMRELFVLKSGAIRIEAGKETMNVEQGGMVSVVTNVPHEIHAFKISELERYKPAAGPFVDACAPAGAR